MKKFAVLFCLLCINFSIITQVHAQTWLTNGLMAYYDFNSNVSDSSGNGNNGVNNGATFTTDRFGTPNYAISFNNNIVTTSFYPPLGGAARTISGWFQVGQPGYTMALYSYGGSPGGTGTRIEADVQTDGSINIDMSNGAFNSTSGGYNDSNWHQLAIVVPSDTSVTNLVIYIDGTVQGVMTGQASFINTTTGTPLEFGQFYGDSRPLTGLLDEMRVYDRDLSACEIQQLFQYESTNEVLPPPRTATATGTITNGFFIGATITDPGFGYTNVPGVHIIGVGSGAKALAVISNGMVVAISIQNAGSGYTNVPQVIIDPPVMLNPVLNLLPMSTLVFSNLTVGSNYQLQAMSLGSWTNQPGNFTATNSVYAQVVAGLPGSANYRLVRAPLPIQATATAQVVYGFLVGINITTGGTGYASPPTVQITDSTGSGATATATVSGGTVTHIAVNTAGSGYSSTPSIVISPPTVFSTVSPTASPVMRLDCSQLFPFTNCQVQVSSNLASAWNNWSGGLFIPTTTTNSLFWSPTNKVGLFRLKYSP